MGEGDAVLNMLQIGFCVLVTAVCGICVVVWETPQNFLLLGSWMITAFLVLFRELRPYMSPRRLGILTALHVFVMGGIIAAGIAAPVKRIDAVLKQPVHLPSAQLTLAELSDYCRENRRSLPLAISLPNAGQGANSQLRFSAARMPLRQFISEVEGQTGCRHVFGGCGNATTILRGRAYNFGLDFRPPAHSQLTWR